MTVEILETFVAGLLHSPTAQLSVLKDRRVASNQATLWKKGW